MIVDDVTQDAYTNIVDDVTQDAHTKTKESRWKVIRKEGGRK